VFIREHPWLKKKGFNVPVRAIFWDNDGVLVDTEILYYRASAETLQSVGISLSRDAFIDISLRKGESVFDLAEAAGYSAKDCEDLRDLRNRRYSELLASETKVIRYVEETLQALHGTVMMAIVTGSRRDHFDIIHRRSGLLQYFDFVLTREDYLQPKPYPDAYLAALERSALRPEECLVVEDSMRGLQAARSAGLPCLVIPGHMTAGNDFSQATRILSDVREVLSAIAF
jgi:HAD superfamily hydrolase (TIGR01509 family)